MPSSNWTPTGIALPPEGVEVETISPSGMQQRMTRSGGLWFIDGGAMYVYYSPIYWKELA